MPVEETKGFIFGIMNFSIAKRLYFVALLMLVSVGVFAQSDVDSPYSIFGVGQLANKSMSVRL